MCFSDGAVKSKGKNVHILLGCVTVITFFVFLAKWIFCCLLLRMVISPHFPKHTSMNNYKVSMMAHLKIIMCSIKKEQQQQKCSLHFILRNWSMYGIANGTG